MSDYVKKKSKYLLPNGVILVHQALYSASYVNSFNKPHLICLISIDYIFFCN